MSEETVAARAERGQMFAVFGAKCSLSLVRALLAQPPTSLDTVEQQSVDADMYSRQRVLLHNLRSGLCLLSWQSASHRRQQ